MVYLLGHRPSPPEKMGLGRPTHLGSVSIQNDVVLPMPSALDQYWQDCTANSAAATLLATMTDTLSEAQGISWGDAVGQLPLPSRRWAYRLTRALIGEIGRDEGGYIYDTVDAFSKLGFPMESGGPPESILPYASDPLVRDAPWDENIDRAAKDQIWVRGAERITSGGVDRVGEVAAAINLGERVLWGTSLDQAFTTLSATDVWPGRKGARIGGHAMVLHEAHWDPNRKIFVFGTRSSWGVGYAKRGTAMIHQDAVSSVEASDFWLIKGAPMYTGTV